VRASSLGERHEARFSDCQTEEFFGVSGTNDGDITERQSVEVLGGVLKNRLVPFSVVHPAVVLDHLDSVESGLCGGVELSSVLAEELDEWHSLDVSGAAFHRLVSGRVLAVVGDVLSTVLHGDEEVLPLGGSWTVRDLFVVLEDTLGNPLMVHFFAA